MNPASIMKLMSAKSQFERKHPKFVAFVKSVFSKPLEEGTILEITVTRPGAEPVTANIKVQQSDLDLLEELKEWGRVRSESMDNKLRGKYQEALNFWNQALQSSMEDYADIDVETDWRNLESENFAPFSTK